MTKEAFFGKAKWVGAPADREGKTPVVSILRRSFQAKKGERALLTALGLGFFRATLNGIPVCDNPFLPLATDYEKRDVPRGEVLSGHRIYVPSFDLSELIREGENVLAIHFGGGWYASPDTKYGDAKAIWRLTLGEGENARELISSEEDRIGESFVCAYSFTRGEAHDYTRFDDAFLRPGYDDSRCPRAEEKKPVETRFMTTDCPGDAVCGTLPPRLLREQDGIRVYDCGQNVSGWPVILSEAARGEEVEVLFSEELDENGFPDPAFMHGQHLSALSDGKPRVLKPLLTWYGFRYFSIRGKAFPDRVEVVHTDIEATAGFSSSDETLNWLFKTYLHTQLTNMHAGIPSDCPHIERRGYTGDGQLTCHAAMTVLDGKAFYRKWMEDIADCQDELSGHIQYTAPYVRSGGGPGGWGIAVVEVPYQYYKHYGDGEPFRAMYPRMMRYFDYLESHSDGLFVTRDKEGEWCLGDWCAPGGMILPAPFVNNYFYIKAIDRILEVSEKLGLTKDLELLRKRREERRRAVRAAYFNSFDGSFFGGRQAADAFALDIGLGDERTLKNLVARYEELGAFDTGIFGTEVLIRVLFERGERKLALRLLSSDGKFSFGAFRKAGATTLWEYWPDCGKERSHNHPMFGAAAAWLFEGVLGLRQRKGDAGYERIVISPALDASLDFAEGFMTVPRGRVAVSFRRKEGTAWIRADIPRGVEARFAFGGEERALSEGRNEFEISL